MLRNFRKILITILFVGFVIAAIAPLITSCNFSQSVDSNNTPKTVKQPYVIEVPENVAQEVDIKNETVEVRTLAGTLHVTGQIKPDVGKEINVTTRFSGRVADIRVSPGQFVKKGDILALVDSHEISNLQAELLEAKAKLLIAEAQQEREHKIYQENTQRPKALLQAQAHFEQSEVQLKLAESEFERISGLYKEKISATKDYLAAKAALEKTKTIFNQATVDLQREERLYKNTGLMKRDYQLAAAETARARQHFNILQQRLEFLGMQPYMVREILRTNKIKAVVPITAPTNGILTHLGVAPGEVIDSGKKAFTITDLSTVLVTADIPEVDLPQVKIGSPVKIKVASYPNERFQGTVSYISEHVNPETRTVAIKVKLPNPEKRLKSNMFAEIDIAGEPRRMLACPKAALQERSGHKVVYLLRGNKYIEQPVEMGRETEDYFEVIAGLNPGDKVATQGSLLLKSELMH